MVHSQVATDALVEMEKAMKRDGIVINDKQLACARINSVEGKNYLAGKIAKCVKFCNFINFAFFSDGVRSKFCICKSNDHDLPRSTGVFTHL